MSAPFPTGAPHTSVIDADGVVHVTWSAPDGRVWYARSDRPGWSMDMPRNYTWTQPVLVRRRSLLVRMLQRLRRRWS